MEVVPFPRPTNSMDTHLMRGESAAYLNCPTSPSGLSSIGSPQLFYTEPSSPTRGLTSNLLALEAPAVEKTKMGAGAGTDSNSDNFEFEISFELSQSYDSAYIQQREELQQVEELPTNMSFADELFSNGRVLPLKLPPRQQKLSYGSSSTSHLRSSSSLVQHGPSSGLTFKNKDFDPFEAAPEKARKEEPEWRPQLGHRRVRSFSSRSYHWTEEPAMKVPQSVQEMEPSASVEPKRSAFTNARSDSLSVMPAEAKRHGGPVECELGKPVKMKAMRSKSENPVGNSCESTKERRPTGPIRSSSERPVKPTPEPIQNENDDRVSVKKSFFRKGSKKQMIKDFLFRSASEGRVDRKDKLRDHTAAMQSSECPKDMSFGSAHGLLYKSSEDERNKTSMAYKPSAMFDCLRMKDRKKKKKKKKKKN